MKDREMQRLMNDVLDGTASPEDSERLHRALESREEVRAEYKRLGGVFAALSGVGMEEPPPELKQGILRAIRARAAAPAREGWLESITSVFRVRPRFGYAYSFAAGTALGVLAFALLTGNLMTRPGSDSRSITGTMAPAPEDPSYRRIASKDFSLHGGRVQAETLYGRDGILARVTAQAPRGTEIVVSFDPGDWSAEAVRQNPAGNEVMLGFGRLSVRMQKFGESQYLLYLARRGPAGSPLRIAIHSPDGLVHGELETGAPRSGS